MTPEQAQELLRRLARIDRRIRVAGTWAALMVAGYLAGGIIESKQFVSRWGESGIAEIVVFVVVFAVASTFLREFNKD